MSCKDRTCRGQAQRTYVCGRGHYCISVLRGYISIIVDVIVKRREYMRLFYWWQVKRWNVKC